MSDSFDFVDASTVVPGTIGEPGARTFFLQAHTELGVVSFKVEKQQVAALCDYFEAVLADLPEPVGDGPDPTAMAIEPLEVEWTVGGLGVAWDDDERRLLVVAEELVFAEEDDEGSDEREPATARFHLSTTQIVTFIELGNALVHAGRPACRLCGRPIDVDGHTCPRLN